MFSETELLLLKYKEINNITVKFNKLKKLFGFNLFIDIFAININYFKSKMTKKSIIFSFLFFKIKTPIFVYEMLGIEINIVKIVSNQELLDWSEKSDATAHKTWVKNIWEKTYNPI